mmetsp:Transcript_7385/g.18974  ORF Transcript_7385/g.18974 Transcript_7385/m.18974 type:complete len:249 (-) Transcript_7385:80-826(-)
MASFQLKTGTIFMLIRWSTVSRMPVLKEVPRKSLRVTSSWEQERSMWLNSRSYRLIRPLCPDAAAARRSAPTGFPILSLSSFRVCSCRGLLFRICSRRMRCSPDPTAPDVTRMISRPLRTSPSSCSIRFPMRPSARRPSHWRDTTCLPTLTMTRRECVSLVRSSRHSATSERGEAWPEDASGVLVPLLLAPLRYAPRWTCERPRGMCLAPPMCTSVSALGTCVTCVSMLPTASYSCLLLVRRSSREQA